jgi:S-(hydroxymethyl)glutathione dehydrogenase/alcohol dehydrogenase
LTGVGAVLFVALATAGCSVVVLGAGGVGQFVVQGARIAGADVIVSVDRSRDAGRRLCSLGPHTPFIRTSSSRA